MYNSDEFRKMATDLDSIQECIMQVYKENIKDNVDIKLLKRWLIMKLGCQVMKQKSILK